MNTLINGKAPICSFVLTISILATAAMGADKSGEVAKANKQHGDTNVSGANHMAKVTGVGGVFFKSNKSPKALAEWYQKNLGMPLEPWGGAVLRWRDDQAEDGGGTAWHVKENDSDMFSPSQSSFMINYRIDDMDKMINQLKANGVSILKGPESHENGKFLWVMDPDGNKVELWEPKIWDEKNKKL